MTPRDVPSFISLNTTTLNPNQVDRVCRLLTNSNAQGYAVSYSIGMAGIPWVLLSEVYNFLVSSNSKNLFIGFNSSLTEEEEGFEL